MPLLFYFFCLHWNFIKKVPISDGSDTLKRFHSANVWQHKHAAMLIYISNNFSYFVSQITLLTSVFILSAGKNSMLKNKRVIIGKQTAFKCLILNTKNLLQCFIIMSKFYPQVLERLLLASLHLAAYGCCIFLEERDSSKALALSSVN